MSVIRNGTTVPGKNGPRPKGGGISVRCPKCQGSIMVSAIDGREAIRCGKCRYPMIRGEDLRAVIAACRKATGPGQANSAAGILESIMEYMPEAGTALGELAAKYTLPMSENDRWNALTAAYAGGDENAREWLNLMCRTSPDRYQQCLCKSCGAPRYMLKNARSGSPCIYCRQAD